MHNILPISPVHYVGKLKERSKSNIFEAMNDEAQYVQDDRYADTKLISVGMSHQLSKHPLLKDVIVCSVNPGFCRSEIHKEFPVFTKE